jgi:hypothetical protein
MADIDQVSNQLQSMKNVLRQYKTASNGVSPQADKLDKLAKQWQQIDSKVGKALDAGQGRDWEPLKRDYRSLRDDWTKAERAAASKASAAAAQQDHDGHGSDSAQHGGGLGSRTGLASGMAINMAPLDTEEALQREKLQGVVEIEGQMNDLKSIYTDFNEMVQDQQKGLDTMESNVDKSIKSVESGVKDLKGASKVQKSSRKWMCAIIVIVAIAICGAIVAVVVTQANK